MSTGQRYTVSDSNGRNARTYSAPNVRSAAEAYDTSGVLNMSGADSVTVTVVGYDLRAVTMTDGRTLTVRTAR